MYNTSFGFAPGVPHGTPLSEESTAGAQDGAGTKAQRAAPPDSSGEANAGSAHQDGMESQERRAPAPWLSRSARGTAGWRRVMPGLLMILAACAAREAYRGEPPDAHRVVAPVYTNIWYSLSCDAVKSRLEVAFYAYNLMERALGDLLDEEEWCIGFTLATASPIGSATCHYNLTKPVRLADPEVSQRRCRIPMIDPAKRSPGEYQVGDFHPHWNGSLPSNWDTQPNTAVTEVLILGQTDFPDVGYIRFVSPRRTPTGEPRRMYLIDATTGRALRNGDGIAVPRLDVPKLDLDIEAQKVP